MMAAAPHIENVRPNISLAILRSGTVKTQENTSEVPKMYRFGTAAQAIGVKEQTLRNWMVRNAIDLFYPRPGKGWHVFTLNDVFVLSVAAELIRYGATVNDAVNAARAALGGMDFETMVGMPAFIHAAPSADGGWIARDDEGMVRTITGAAAVVKIDIPVCLNAARRRLALAVASAIGES